MLTKHWQKINQGDTACIVAPSYGVTKSDDLNATIAKAMDIVESYGLTPLMYKDAVLPGNHTLFDDVHLRLSNSEEVKITQLIAAFNNPVCSVVWSFKGGYGAIRLLSGLAKEPVPQIVKPFIGFSDITIIHSYINNIWGWPSIHFGMPGSLQDVMQRNDTKQSLQNIIFAKQHEVTFTLSDVKQDSVNNSTIKGITAGGNMFNFDKLLGTKFSPILSNRIIILEDIDEPARKIDGFLQKLKLMPDFEKISAVVFSTFTPLENQPIFYKVFKEFSSSISIPVFMLDAKDAIGHGDINQALPLGSEGEIKFNGSSFQLMVALGVDAADIHSEL